VRFRDAKAAELSALINHSNATVVEGGTWRCERSVILESPVDLELDLSELTLVRSAVNWGVRKQVAQLIIRNAVNTHVKLPAIVGPLPEGLTGRHQYRPAVEGQHGVLLSGGVDVTLEGRGETLAPDIEAVNGDLVYLASAGRVWPQGVTVEHVVGRRAGRHGLCVTAGRDVDLRDCQVSDVGRRPAHFEINSKRAGDGFDEIRVDRVVNAKGEPVRCDGQLRNVTQDGFAFGSVERVRRTVIRVGV
jgi:hypothetical protein